MMLSWTGWLLCLIVASWSHRVEAYEYKEPPRVLSPGEKPLVFESRGYPRAAINGLRQTSSWAVVSKSKSRSGVKIVCEDVRFPDETSCQETWLKFKDGDQEKVYCGQSKPFSFLSRGEELRAELKVGDSGRLYLSCTVQAVQLDSDGKELKSYLDVMSEEVDSEEHGAAPGNNITTCPCGWANKVSSRIVNGVVTAPNEFPFAAALVLKEDLWHFCGATIITSWHALTAVHCTIGWEDAEPMALLVGNYRLSAEPDKDSRQVIDVRSVVEHRGYVPGKHVDDISLLVLSNQISFSSNVGPACLPAGHNDLTGQYVKIIGWGHTRWQGERSDLPRKVNVRVVNIQQCAAVYSPVRNRLDNPTHLCTFGHDKASCQGDSGGPVVWVDPASNRYTLVGVVSFGKVCADRNPTVHSDVSAYLDWIRLNVRATQASAEICYSRA